MPRHDYPRSVLEVVDDEMKFRTAPLRALRRFAEIEPWRGSLEQRKEKFRWLNGAISRAYGMSEPELLFETIDGSPSGCSSYSRLLHQIVLRGKLSVVTYLHEFAHALGKGERGACRWSINLFRRIFPERYARLEQRGHLLIRPGTMLKNRSLRRARGAR